MRTGGSWIAVILAAVMCVIFVPSANAAPVHDDSVGAMRIGLNDPIVSSNAGANNGLEDPPCEWSTIHRTVWFRFRPSSTMDVVARAQPLDGTDVEFALLTSGAEGHTVLGCEDAGWDEEDENLRFRATGGVTYYFMVGNASPNTPGGRVAFDIHRPLRISPRLDDVSWTKASTGDAVVTGRVRCSRTKTIEATAILTQSDRAGEGSSRIRCREGALIPWLIRVYRYEGDKFSKGWGTLELEFFHDDDDVRITRLRRGPVISCTRIGTLGDDRMSGSPGPDRLCGLYGDDRLAGGGRNDLLIGHFGNDQLIGLGGSDRLEGGPGNDVLRGGDGRDVLIGHEGSDELDGGPSRDVCRPGAGRDRLVSCERR